MRQSPRRNGRNKGLKVKHVVQISMLLGVSIWLLYQAHHSDGRKTSVTTNISHRLNNVSSDDDVSKLGRKVLRPKVNGTKESQAEEKGNNENEASEQEDVVEDHESDEHEEGGENERENGDKGREESGLENENNQMSQNRRHEGKQKEELKGTLNKNKSDEQNEGVVMEKTEKEVEMSSPSKEDDDQSVRDEVENDKMMNNGENHDDQRREDDDQSIRPSTDHNEENNKDLYSLEPSSADTMQSTWNDKNMKADTDSEAQDKIGESTPNTEFDQKDGVSVLEEEKDALTDLETLPESGTGGSIIQENAATE